MTSPTGSAGPTPDGPAERARTPATPRTTGSPTTGPETALVIPTGPGAADVLGRARPVAPSRREGPAKLTGVALYTDDLVFPGAWFGATVRIDGGPRPAARRSTSTPASTGDASWSSRPPTSPATTSSASSRTTSRSSCRSAARSATTPSRVALVAAPDRATLREARRRVRLRTEPLPPVLDPLLERARVRPLRDRARATSTPAFAAADVVVEGEYRVGHQEQLYIENNAMIAVPAARTAA